MEMKINDELYSIPTDLSEITVAQFLDYYEGFGKNLDKQLSSILTRQYIDEFERELDLSDHIEQEGIAWLSFFTGFDFSQLKAEDLVPVHTMYRCIKSLLKESENEQILFAETIDWNEQSWEIKSYEISEAGKVSFNELNASKQVARFVKKLEIGQWEVLPKLCAVLLRKKGEAFDSSLIADDGERMQLMNTLPMSHALKVAFFVAVSLNAWSSTLESKTY